MDGVHPYLDDWSNREGVRLLTKCPLGYLVLMQSVAKMLPWPVAGGNCVLCGDGEVEDVTHFLQRCPRLQPCRDRLARESDCRLRNAGVPGAELLALLQAGGTSQLRALLGADVGYAPTDVELHKQWAFARWTLDKLAKNFLLACWRLRGAYLGELQVERAVLSIRRASSALQICW